MMEKCKICSDKTDLILIKDKTYHICEKCGFISLDKKHLLSEKDEKQRYLKHENSLKNKGYVDFLNNFIEKAVIPKKPKTILDFGSGPNPILKELLIKKGFEVSTYDYYFDKNEHYKTKKYDMIVSVEVLEHIKEPLKKLKELKKLLNKDGTIAIMTSFHQNNLEKFKDWWYITDPTHISFFSENTIKIVADKLDMKFSIIDPKNIFILTN